MQTRRGTVLGKRGHSEESASASTSKNLAACEQLQTPESSPNPKRPRTSINHEDDGSNKENIPPFKGGSVNGEIPPSRRTRVLRRSATEDITPTSIRLGIQRSTSVSSLPPSTPVAEIATLAISTPPPTPPTSLVPLNVRIRALLRSTCNNSQTRVSGRDKERATILNFLAPFIDGTCMNHDKIRSNIFISGSPGTGKTALINTLIRQLSADNATDLRVISINCMALKTLDSLWERILEELADASPKKRPAGKKLKGREAVRSMLDTLKVKCILILDELDHIAPNEQSLSSIFTLTDSLRPTLRLIGIANTHTLTSSSSTTFLSSTNVETVHFAPYTAVELQEILQSRLASLSNGDSPDVDAEIKKFLPKPTIVLLAKKIAALTGDVRCLFEVLRGAIDMAVGATRKTKENPFDTPLPVVTTQHVLAAFKAYTPSAPPAKSNAATAPIGSASTSNNETLNKIRNLGLQARVVLLTMILASKRLQAGFPLAPSASVSPRKPSPIKRSFSMPNPMPTSSNIGIDTSALHAYYRLVLSLTDNGIFEPVSRSEFSDLLGMLEGVGLVSLSSSISTGTPKGKRAFSRSTSFGAGLIKNGAGGVGEVRLVEGVWGEEVLRCLGVSGENTPADPREEEVRGIWERENSRLSKDIKAQAAATKNSDIDILSGAFQL